MPVTNHITNELKQIIAEKLDINIKLEEVSDNAYLFEELGLDSIAVVELIHNIEETFGFEFGEDDLDMEYFENMQTLSQFIASKL